MKIKPLIVAFAFTAIWLSAAWHAHLEGAGFLPEHSHGHSHDERSDPAQPHSHDDAATAADSHVPLVVRGHQELEVFLPGLLLLGAVLIATKLLLLLWRAWRSAEFFRAWRPPLSAEKCARCSWQFALRCAPISAAPPALV